MVVLTTTSAVRDGLRPICRRGRRHHCWGQSLIRRALPFHSSCGDALDEGFLGDEEEGDHGEDDQDGGGHEELPGGAAGLGLEELQGQGQGEILTVDQVDEGAQEIVPGAHEGEEADDGQGGA